MIYYCDKILPKRSHVLEAGVIKIEIKQWSDVSNTTDPFFLPDVFQTIDIALYS